MENLQVLRLRAILTCVIIIKRFQGSQGALGSKVTHAERHPPDDQIGLRWFWVFDKFDKSWWVLPCEYIAMRIYII